MCCHLHGRPKLGKGLEDEARGGCGAACAMGICSYGGGWKTRWVEGARWAGRPLPLSSFEIGSGAGVPA